MTEKQERSQEFFNKKTHIFISHCSEDDEIVKHLRESMEIQRLDTWVDSNKMRGGDKLEKKIIDAIDTARAFIVVLSPKTINSKWVRKEIKYALEVRKQREKFPIIPVMLEGFEEDALDLYFEEQPVALEVKMGRGGVNAAMPHILVALGLREPSDIQSMTAPETIPAAELVLTLSRPGFVEIDGKRRARAEARLTYSPPKQNTAGMGKWFI